MKDTDIPLESFARRDHEARCLPSKMTDDVVKAWVDAMSEDIEQFQTGQIVVYLDGHYFPIEKKDVDFVGIHSIHSWERLPHAEEIDESGFLLATLGDHEYWLERERPEIIIIAGPNGAGKTTFAQQHIANIGGEYEFVNADEIAKNLSDKHLSQTNRDLIAARRMLKRIDVLAKSGGNFIVETTLSGLGYLAKIKGWQNAGYRIILMFIRLEGANTAVQRVRQRVAAGGHDIPEATIRRRFSKGLENFEMHFKTAVDRWYIIDSLDGEFHFSENSDGISYDER